MMTIIQQLATGFIERSEALGLKGKARDRALMDYWAGAYLALVETDHGDADWVGRVGVMVLSVRGYSELERLMKEDKE